MKYVSYIILIIPFLLLLNSPSSAYSITFIGTPSLVLNPDGSLQSTGVLGQVDKNVNVLLKTSSGTGVFKCDIYFFGPGNAPYPGLTTSSSQTLQNGSFNIAPDNNKMVNFDIILSKPIAKYTIQDQCQSKSSNLNGINTNRILTNATYNNIALSVQYFDDPATDILTKTWDEIKIPS
jgi:hypothetical protein